jgi:2-hydroxy-3-keto-5-methylthiopentenyl-1-phosphate phosphatase
MDTSLIPLIHQFYNKWTATKQEGELVISATTIRWTNADQSTTLDLYPIIANARQTTIEDLLVKIQNKDSIQRLRAYFELGKFIKGKTRQDLQTDNIKPFKLKAARRVYEFYSACGEETLDIEDTVTATSLAKLSEANFAQAIEERQAILLLFAGAQNGTRE